MMYCVEVFMVVAVLLSTNENAYGQSISFGSCPTVSVVQNFVPTSYVGRWYEIKRVINSFQFGGSCVTADYTAEKDSDGFTGNIIVKNSMKTWYGKKQSIEGKAAPQNRSSMEAKYLVSFEGVPATGSYWVLDTDYKSYSVVYSCTSILDIINLKFIWFLSREPKVSQSTLEKMQGVLTKNGVFSYLLMETDQNYCQYT